MRIKSLVQQQYYDVSSASKYLLTTFWAGTTGLKAETIRLLSLSTRGTLTLRQDKDSKTNANADAGLEVCKSGREGSDRCSHWNRGCEMKGELIGVTARARGEEEGLEE